MSSIILKTGKKGREGKKGQGERLLESPAEILSGAGFTEHNFISTEKLAAYSSL